MKNYNTLMALADAYANGYLQDVRDCSKNRAALSAALDELIAERDQLHAEVDAFDKNEKSFMRKAIEFEEERDAANAYLVKHCELLVKHLAVIDPLRAERDALNSALRKAMQEVADLAMLADQYKAERDANTMNALRYQFLRMRDHGKNFGVEVRMGGYTGMYWNGLREPFSENKLDEAIDAAMKGTPT